MTRLRTATTSIHTPCGAEVITGLDHDRTAGLARVDPTPLTALGEALALIEGRDTYTLTWRASTPELDPRDQWTIPNHPINNTLVVLPEHRCDTPAAATRGDTIHLPDGRTATTNPDLFTTTKENNNDCPF